MTEQELRELDAEVAVEVMGYELVKVRPRGQKELRVMRRCVRGEIGDYSTYFLEDGTKLYCGKPFAPTKLEHYSTDIAAAWEVVEKMVSDGRVFIVKGDGVRTGDHNPKWTVLVANMPRVDANTAPIAICRAALAAVRSQPPASGS